MPRRADVVVPSLALKAGSHNHELSLPRFVFWRVRASSCFRLQQRIRASRVRQAIERLERLSVCTSAESIHQAPVIHHLV